MSFSSWFALSKCRSPKDESSRERKLRRAKQQVRPVVETLEDRTLPSNIVVNNPTDTPVAGETDLRQAIAQANANGGNETITFDPAVFATAQTITLNGTQLELTDTIGIWSRTRALPDGVMTLPLLSAAATFSGEML